MRKIRNVFFVVVFHCVCASIVFAADESGAVQPATTEKYQKVRKQLDELQSSPAGKRAPEVVEQARQSIATAQEGLKRGSDKMTRDYTEMAALQVTLAGALAEERDAATETDSARKQLASQARGINK
jgi:hypothetical protein